MKAKKLAEILLQHPELEVVVSGYEANLNPVKTVIKTVIQPASNRSSYYGEYDHLGTRTFLENSQDSVKALYIGYSEGSGDGVDTVAGEVLVREA